MARSPEFSLVLSERLVDCLMIENFKFIKQSVLKCGKTKWRCENRITKCPAKCYTEGEPLVLVNYELHHNHEPDVKRYTRQGISNSCKRKAEEDLYSKPSKIIRCEVSSSKNKESLSERDVDSIRRVIRYTRNKTLPALPKSMEETQLLLDELSPITDQGEPFLLENDHRNNIVVFGCKTNVDELRTASSIMVDGTFDYCCKYFNQLFTIFTVKNGHYIPVLFCLLPNKKESSYQCLFSKVKIMIGNDNLREIMVDFEVAIHNALKKTWPSAEILGCRFHLTQSWFRKIQNLGLATVYRSPNENSIEEMAASKWLRGIFGLAFLCAEEVGNSFVEDFMEDIPAGAKYEKFADYLVENYIEEGTRFPPKMWASFDRNNVTNNPCESFHAHFQKNFYHPHPDIHTFTRRLVDHQTFVYIKIRSISEPPRPLGGKFRKAKQKLEDAKRMFLLGNLPRKDFVIAASKRYLKQ